MKNLINSAKMKNTNEIITRPFVPISSIDDPGFVDILARIHRPNKATGFEGGQFSNFIEQIQVN